MDDFWEPLVYKFDLWLKFLDTTFKVEVFCYEFLRFFNIHLDDFWPFLLPPKRFCWDIFDTLSLTWSILKSTPSPILFIEQLLRFTVMYRTGGFLISNYLYLSLSMVISFICWVLIFTNFSLSLAFYSLNSSFSFDCMRLICYSFYNLWRT